MKLAYQMPKWIHNYNDDDDFTAYKHQIVKALTDVEVKLGQGALQRKTIQKFNTGNLKKTKMRLFLICLGITKFNWIFQRR